MLREELAFQHEGIVACVAEDAEDSQRKSEVKHEVKSLEKADHDKAIQTTLEKRKRDQALKDADRLNQQLTELRNESEGFERESAEALSVVPPPPPGSDALQHLEGVLREREAELCDLERARGDVGEVRARERGARVLWISGMVVGERGLQKTTTARCVIGRGRRRPCDARRAPLARLSSEME